ncbi:MAG: hypothetical protein WD114_01050 [Phycisphaerales bacterium]
MSSNIYIEKFAAREGIAVGDVDPYEIHYVTGLEHVHRGNRPDDFETLSDEAQMQVLNWIEQTFEQASSTHSCPMSSYGLKHWFGNESTTEHSWWHNPNGFYITNGQFKGAMLKAGFSPDNPNACNPRYKLKLREDVKGELRKYHKHGYSRDSYLKNQEQAEQLLRR